jgi:1-acyl-sn-glycerol-3-phosphate acyltransferase
MEPVFRALVIAARAPVKAVGSEISYQGLENIPRGGGAVVAINHTSYVDWLSAGFAAHYRGRRCSTGSRPRCHQ